MKTNYEQWVEDCQHENAIKSRTIIKCPTISTCCHTGLLIACGDECLRTETNGGIVRLYHKDSETFKLNATAATFTKSLLALANEAMDANEQTIRMHNQIIAAKLNHAAIVLIDDPVEQKTRHQRAIIELALAALGTGDSAKVRNLLGEL